MRFSSSIVVAAAALPLAYGSVLAERATSGIATWYAGAVGACSFDGYTYPTGVYGTALGLNLWNTAAQCGACVSVTNASGKKITAMVSSPNHLKSVTSPWNGYKVKGKWMEC